MEQWHVRDVMTKDVVAVREDTPYREIVTTLADHRISSAPVVDASRRVLGVVSESDLLPKVEYTDRGGKHRLFGGRRQRVARAKAAGDLARELMTAPAVTTPADAPIPVAARRMDDAKVTQLPVADDLGRLVGIVTRGDLLRVFRRPDADIRRDVAERIQRRVLAFEAGTIRVEVHRGVATLTGRTDRRSTARFALRVAGTVPGVVDVVDELDYNMDDTA